MWALIRNNEVIEIFEADKPVVIDDTRHSSQILGPAWTEAERNALGLFKIQFEGLRNPRFWKEAGCEYLIGKGRVIGRKAYKPADLDKVREEIRTEISNLASRVIYAAMNRNAQRNSLAEMVLFLMSLTGAVEPVAIVTDTARARMVELVADWRYLEEVRAFAAKIERDLDAVADMEALELFAWSDGWPLQKK